MCSPSLLGRVSSGAGAAGLDTDPGAGGLPEKEVKEVKEVKEGHGRFFVEAVPCAQSVEDANVVRGCTPPSQRRKEEEEEGSRSLKCCTQGV